MLEDTIKSITKVSQLSSNLRILNNDQALSIVDDIYSDAKFAQLAYSICCNSFVLGNDRELSDFDEINICDSFPKCCIKATSLQHPGKYGFIKEFQYYSSTYKLKGTKVFSVEILEELELDFLLQALVRRTVEKKSSKDVENESFMIALHREDSVDWDIAFIYKHTRYPQLRNGTKLTSMGQDYIAVEIHNAKQLIWGIDKGFDVRELRTERHIIKL